MEYGENATIEVQFDLDDHLCLSPSSSLHSRKCDNFQEPPLLTDAFPFDFVGQSTVQALCERFLIPSWQHYHLVIEDKTGVPAAHDCFPFAGFIICECPLIDFFLQFVVLFLS
jgi:hypothetical protein